MTASSVNYRTFVVANPCAGAGSVKEEWRLIERLLRANLPELDYAFTEGPGHATLLAREALKNGWEMVVSVGGDGTLNEVINGFFDKKTPQQEYEMGADGWLVDKNPKPRPINDDAVLGLVPLGTGGDFRRTVGFMGGLADTIEHLRGRATRQIDLGQVGFLDHQKKLASRYFINIASAGLGGRVDQAVNSSWKGLGGTTSFMWGSFRAFASWRNIDVEVRIDETTEVTGKMLNLVVANGAYFGGGMWVAPGAQVGDGCFDVVLMGDLSKLEATKVMRMIYSGKHLGCKGVSRYRASRVAARTVDGDHSFPLDIDGEPPGDLPAVWNLHPRMVNFKI